jgi:ferritin-like metal-binding protein YciE
LSRSGRKIVQYLSEAHAAEVGLRRDIQAQIATTPAGRYRTALERHLRETSRHAGRLHDRLDELGETRGLVQSGIGTATTLAAQLLSLGRAPLELVRGTGGEERVLRNARTTCAAEAHEIATYTALERLARDAGDRRTAKLAAWIRADEEAMLKKVLAEIPALAEAVARASFEVEPPKELTRTAGTGAARPTNAGRRANAARREANGARREANGARREANGATPPANGTTRPAAGTRGSTARPTSGAAHARSGSASGPTLAEPWAGYDELPAIDVIAALDGASEARVRRTREYERSHKRRSTVIKATERELARS